MSTVRASPSTMSSATSLPTTGACWNPWPLNPFARNNPSTGDSADDRVTIGRHLVQARPHTRETRVFDRREHTHRGRQQLLFDESMVDVSAERRLLVATAHARQDAVAFLVEVVRWSRRRSRASGARAPREPARRHDHARDGFQWKVYAGGRRERPRPRPRRVHHDGAAMSHPPYGRRRPRHPSSGSQRPRRPAAVGARTTSERRVPLREPCRIGDPVVRAERRTDDVIDRDARRDAGRLVGVSNCVSTPSDRCNSAPARNSAQSCSSRTRNRYPSCTTSSGSPCSSVNPRIIGTLAMRQLDVDPAGELMAEPAISSPVGSTSNCPSPACR